MVIHFFYFKFFSGYQQTTAEKAAHLRHLPPSSNIQYDIVTCACFSILPFCWLYLHKQQL